MKNVEKAGPSKDYDFSVIKLIVVEYSSIIDSNSVVFHKKVKDRRKDFGGGSTASLINV